MSDIPNNRPAPTDLEEDLLHSIQPLQEDNSVEQSDLNSTVTHSWAPTDVDLEPLDLDRNESEIVAELSDAPHSAPTESLELELDEGDLDQTRAEEVFVDLPADEILAEDRSTGVNTDLPPLILGARMVGKQRPAKSALSKIIPPILGGLAAFPIATAIMWYGFGKDLGSTGPTVAKYVPWIVPKHLRGSSAFGADGRSAQWNARANEPDIRQKNTELGFLKSDLPSLASGLGNTSTSLTTNTPKQQPETKVDVPDEPSRSDDASTKPTTESISIRSILDDIREQETKWSSTPKEREAQLRAVANYYGAFCKLAERTDEVGPKAIKAWERDFNQFGKHVLSSKLSRVLIKVAHGEIPNIANYRVGNGIATIESMTISRNKSGDQSFSTLLNNENARIVIAPEIVNRLPFDSEMERRYLVLGRLEERDGQLVVLAHLCISE